MKLCMYFLFTILTIILSLFLLLLIIDKFILDFVYNHCRVISILDQKVWKLIRRDNSWFAVLSITVVRERGVIKIVMFAKSAT